MKPFLILATLLLSLASYAADASGKWKATIEGQQGTIEVEYNFKVEADKLTGTVNGPMGEVEITDGTTKDDEIAFIVVAGDRSIPHKGKIVAGEMKLTLDFGERQMELTAKRATP
ncbi:MAG: hypothetical protein U5J83_12470 [Bryobacterales bacterium]|nr:hypothetical protein [Bryobacterales bacterium]